MNREDFYEQYRQARAAVSAAAMFSNSCGPRLTIGPAFTSAWHFIDSLHPSVIYAVHNRWKRTVYNIKQSRWAVAHNSKF